MKIQILILLFLVSCSSKKQTQNDSSYASKVDASAFKKEKPFTSTEVKDFYGPVTGAESPALQDETLDRFSPEDLSKIGDTSDPLAQISLLCSKKDFEKAFEVASKSFQRYQKIAAYWNQVANCHLNRGSERKALLFYNKALEVSPGYVPALNNIGVLYSRQGDDQKALVAFEKANRQSKFAKTPRYNLARLYLRYGLAQSALPLFQGLLGDYPNDVDLLNAVGSSYFMMSDYQRAMSFFSQIPQKFWERAEIGLNVSLSLKKIGKAADAKDVFDRIDAPKSGELKAYHTSVASQLGVKL